MSNAVNQRTGLVDRAEELKEKSDKLKLARPTVEDGELKNCRSVDVDVETLEELEALVDETASELEEFHEKHLETLEDERPDLEHRLRMNAASLRRKGLYENSCTKCGVTWRVYARKGEARRSAISHSTGCDPVNCPEVSTEVVQ